MAITNTGISSLYSGSDINEDLIDRIINATDLVAVDENSSIADMSKSAVFGAAAQNTTDIRELTNLYNAVSGISELEEYDQLGVIRQYVEDSLPAPDYKKFIQEPSGATPLYALQASLENSRLRGDTNSKKLINAATNYLRAKNIETKAFDKTKKAFEFERAQKIDQIAKELFVDYQKGKTEIAKKFADDQFFGNRKMYYLQGTDGQYDYSSPVFFSNVEANAYATKNGSTSIRPMESDDDKLTNVRVETTNPDGTVSFTEEFLPNIKVKQMQTDPNIRITKPVGTTNTATYLITNNEGKKLKQFLNTDQYNNLQNQVNEGELESVVKIPAGTGKYIDTLNNGAPVTITHEQAIVDPERYLAYTSGLEITFNSDGTVSGIKQGSTGGSGNAIYKEGRENYQESFDKATSIATNVLNFHDSNQEVRNIITDFEKQGLDPDALFSDAKTFAKLTTRIFKDVSTFRSILTTPQGEEFTDSDGKRSYKGAGTIFMISDTISNDMNETQIKNNQVDFETFKNKIEGNEEYEKAYQEFSQSPFAKQLLATNVTEEVLRAAFFDLALQSASTYGKGEGLDLRAMSDKDVLFNIRNIGGDASTLEGFLAINNRYTRSLINQNIRKLNNLKDNAPLMESIVKADGQTMDIDSVEQLKNHINNKITELEEISVNYKATPLDLVYGVQGRTYEASDTNVDMTSIFFTPDMLQDPNRAASLSNNFGINSLSQNYDVNTTLSNGDSIKQLIMQYQTFENNNDIDKLNNFLGSLQKRITQEEYKVFNAFNRIFYDLKSKKIEELSGED
jgi:regulator of RNase E activity RraB